jgi:Concanavalin A-like lectin/glucanases superfamily
MATRTLSRFMATAAATAAMAVAVASPAQAAPTVRALWNMTAVPAMTDSSTDGVNNSGTTSNITMSPDGFYTFNGTNSIASAPHKANLNPGTAPITVEAGINATRAPEAGNTFDILRKGTSTTTGGYYKIELKTTSTGAVNAACIFKDKNRVSGSAILTIPTTGWVSISCRKTSSSVTIVANGKTRTVARTVGAIANTAPVYIGGKGDGTDVFPGLMDYAKITIG